MTSAPAMLRTHRRVGSQRLRLPRLSRTPGRIRTLGPRLGQHTHEVLHDLLGMSDDEIEALRESRVI